MEYKNICFAILNKEDTIGDIMKNLKLPKEAKVFKDFDINADTIGKANNFRLEGNKILCDVKFEKETTLDNFSNTLSYGFKPINTEMKGDLRIVEAELFCLALTDNHTQSELNNNLKEEK